MKLFFNIPSKPHTLLYHNYPIFANTFLFFLTFLNPNLFWISLRPISNSQLHALLHFHLCPIYLVFFKGSWDISS